MIVRSLALAGGVAGAASLSQFPEFSQQYMQRLGGAVDELKIITEQYNRDAQGVGLELPEYIHALSSEGELSKTQAGNMQVQLDRYQNLSTALERLQGAGPFMRARLAAHMADQGVAARAYEAFRPAVPVTFEGAVFAGTGFFGGWLGISALFAFVQALWSGVTGLFRRRA